MSNMFALLESDDEEETPKVTTNPKAKTTAKGGAAAAKKPQAGAAAAKPAATSARDDAPIPADKSGGRGGAGRGRGGRGRGGKPKDGEAPPRKREYERRSGTGRGKEVAKGGSGGRNWGNPKTEAVEAEKAPIERDEAAVEEVEVQVEVEEPEPEPEVPTYTLDEYLAQRNSAKANSALFGEVQIRKVEADFSGLKTKDDVVAGSEYTAMGAAKSTNKGKKEQRATAKAVVLDVGFKAAPTESPREERPRREGRGEGRGRGRGGRGEGRGEGRGGRGEGRGRGRGGGGPRVDINDASAFPSL